MAYIPPIQSILDVSQSTGDAIFTNNRKILMGNNANAADAGAGASYTVQVLKASTISGVTTLTATSNTSQYADATGGAFAVTLPAASSTDKVFMIKKIDSSGNAVTVTRAGSDTIEGATTVALSAQYSWIIVQSDGTSAWKVIGRTVPSSGIAPSSDTYILYPTSDSGNLPNSRLLTPGKNIFFTDGGAGSILTEEVGPVTAISSNTTVTATSNTVYICDASGGNITFTLPAASNSNKLFRVKKVDSSTNTVIITRAGSDTIDGATTYTLTVQYQAADVVAGTTANQWNLL